MFGHLNFLVHVHRIRIEFDSPHVSGFTLPKKKVNSKLVNSFIWTDGEVELFTKCHHGEQNVESQGECCSLAQVDQLIYIAALVVDSLNLAKSFLNKDGISVVLPVLVVFSKYRYT